MYTLLLLMANLPGHCRVTVSSALSEFSVTVRRTNAGDFEVSGTEANVRQACTAALQRIGKTIEDVTIDLFG